MSLIEALSHLTKLLGSVSIVLIACFNRAIIFMGVKNENLVSVPGYWPKPGTGTGTGVPVIGFSITGTGLGHPG